MTTSVKRSYYRKSQVHPPSSQNLQQMLSAALNQCSKVKDRLETVDAAANAFRLIAAHETKDGILCGAMVTFERGSYQLVVSDDPDAASLNMGAIAPPANEGKQQQFVPGTLFFAIFEDHLAIVQSSALRATGFEQHLAWLLRTETKQLASNQGLVLADEPKQATVARIKSAHVKSLNIGRPFMEPFNEAAEDGTVRTTEFTEKQKTDVSKLKPIAEVVDFLRSYLPNDRFAKLNLEEAVFDGNLEVWLEIKYPARVRNMPESTVKLIDDLAIAMRDQDENSVQLTLGDGSKIKGSDLKISTALTMKLNSGVPDLADFYSEMRAWLQGLIKNGVVSP